MSVRLKCRACRTAFVTPDDRVGRRVTCPKCGAEQVVPDAALRVPAAAPSPAATVAGEGQAIAKEKATAKASKPAPAGAPGPGPVADAGAGVVAGPETSVFVAADATPRPGRLRKVALGLVLLLVVGAVGVAVSWPALRRWWHPIPPDPVEAVASAYLKALAGEDAEASRRLGTVDEPPAIRSFGDVRRLRDRNRRVKGSFAPIAALHGRIVEKFEYDPAIGRFTPRDPLGPAAETLDALHDARAKAEQEEIARKIAGGNPDDLFDAAEGLAGAMSSITKLADGVLSPRKLVPTYKQLVEESKPPLPPAECELALDYAAHREAWDALLKRPFLTLKADGPFLFDRAEVSATARDRLASLGDPPTTLRLTLVRFRLEGIDTGWKIIAARRPSAHPAPAPEPEPAPAPEPGPIPSPRPGAGEKRSPGEAVP